MKEILKVTNIGKKYSCHNNTRCVLKDINFTLSEGEILGIIGESGSGKSTLLKIIANQLKADTGKVEIFQKEHHLYDKELYKSMQMIFQDAKGSLNPRHTIGKSLSIPKKHLIVDQIIDNKDLLEMVGLDRSYDNKYPHELSGGECQRVAIARAFSVNPKILLCDEVTSSIDVCAQTKILHLLLKLARENKTGLVFVSHDIALVSSFCDKLLIIDHGEIVESGNTKEIINNPSHPYTKDLLDHLLKI